MIVDGEISEAKGRDGENSHHLSARARADLQGACESCDTHRLYENMIDVYIFPACTAWALTGIEAGFGFCINLHHIS